MAEQKISMKKKLLVILASVLMVVCIFVPPFEGLSAEGMKFLGIFIWWIVLMATAVIPGFMACFAALVIAVFTKVTSFAGAFGAFSSSTAILLIGAFGLAAGLSTSGLINRIALNIMKLFPGTYVGQLWATSIASIIVAPTIPSTGAKASILQPVVGTIADELGYEPHSKGAVGLLSCCQTITQFVGLMFLTGGVGAVLIVSLAGTAMGWMEYLKFCLVWGVVLFVLTVLFHQFYYNPNKGVAKDEIKVLDKSVIQSRIDALGKMSKNEKIAIVVLLATVALWMTENVHGISSAAVAVAALVVFSAVGLFTPADFVMKITWPVWAQVGGVLAVCGLLTTTGVASWAGGLVAPIIVPLSGHPIVLILALYVVEFILMFAVVNYSITGAIFASMLAASTLSPVVVVFVVAQASMAFVLEFQQVGVISSIGVSGGRIEHKDIVPAAWAFVVCNLIAVLVSIPWWSILGYM